LETKNLQNQLSIDKKILETKGFINLFQLKPMITSCGFKLYNNSLVLNIRIDKRRIQVVDSDGLRLKLFHKAEFSFNYFLAVEIRKLLLKNRNKDIKDYYKDLLVFFINVLKDKEKFEIDYLVTLRVREEILILVGLLNVHSQSKFAKELVNKHIKTIFNDD